MTGQKWASRFLLCLGCSCLLSAAGCRTMAGPGDSWLGRDKAYHCGAALALAAAAAAAAHGGRTPDGEAAAVGVGFALSFGAGKELYDARIKKTYWSWKDMAWDLIGACMGAALVAVVE